MHQLKEKYARMFKQFLIISTNNSKIPINNMIQNRNQVKNAVKCKMNKVVMKDHKQKIIE